jgi:hypothetical protein
MGPSGLTTQPEIKMTTQMTFEQFQSTGRDVVDLAVEFEKHGLGDLEFARVAGRVYHGSTYIEKGREGKWNLIIGNCEWESEDLTILERELYDFALGEGVLELNSEGPY